MGVLTNIGVNQKLEKLSENIMKSYLTLQILRLKWTSDEYFLLNFLIEIQL